MFRSELPVFYLLVCSIGNDPDWRDREDHYWLSHSFGDLSASAQTRKEVLEALLPKLKIAEQTRVEGRFLIVEGKLKSYGIHLGSSNIQILPSQRYLCIVGTKPYDKVLLPFNGDLTLSLILSKAFLLARDDKIKDPSILSQIRRAQPEIQEARMGFPITIRLKDSATGGGLVPRYALDLLFEQETITVAELIERRVRTEIASLRDHVEPRSFLVELEANELLLNGIPKSKNKPVDPGKAVARALEQFRRSAYFVIVDGKPVEGLDDVVQLKHQMEVEFFRLVPLVGG